MIFHVGANPCQRDNGCSHICLLSSVEISGFSCACPDDLTLDIDGRTCISTSMAYGCLVVLTLIQ